MYVFNGKGSSISWTEMDWEEQYTRMVNEQKLKERLANRVRMSESHSNEPPMNEPPINEAQMSEPVVSQVDEQDRERPNQNHPHAKPSNMRRSNAKRPQAKTPQAKSSYTKPRSKEEVIRTGPEFRTPCEQYELDLLGFAEWERGHKDTIDVKRCYIDVAGDLVGGVMLSQIVYWHLPGRQGATKLRVERAGRLWLAKRREDWWEECRVTPRQVDRVLASLEARKLLVTAVWKFQGDPCKHISLNIAELYDAVHEVLPPSQPSSHSPLMPPA